MNIITKVAMLLVAAASLLLVSACQQPLSHQQNLDAELTPSQSNKPITVLISLDGFRHDYVTSGHAPNLLAIANNGVRAKHMQPVYPTKTFPNHLAIATGKYPGNHGIIHNRFYDRTLKKHYKKGIGRTESHWLYGIPIWTQAELHGVKTATYYWPESEARIQGRTPTYFYYYNKITPYQLRTQQVLDWLKLPEQSRPQLIITYFALVDTMGGDFGPDSIQNQTAIRSVDRLLGDLYQRIHAETDLSVNFIVVSDHGMQTIYSKDIIQIAELDEYEGFSAIDGDTQLLLYANDALNAEEKAQKTRALIKRLTRKSQGRYTVYTPETFPAHWHYQHTERMPDILLEAIPPVTFKTKPKDYGTGGTHGYDPRKYPDMGATFIANGPSFKKNLIIEPFESIHIYPMLAKILNIPVPDDIDGKLATLEPILNTDN